MISVQNKVLGFSNRLAKHGDDIGMGLAKDDEDVSTVKSHAKGYSQEYGKDQLRKFLEEGKLADQKLEDKRPRMTKVFINKSVDLVNGGDSRVFMPGSGSTPSSGAPQSPFVIGTQQKSRGGPRYDHNVKL